MLRIVRLLSAGGSEQGGESDAGAGFGRMSRMTTSLEESRRDTQWKLPGEDRRRRCKREVNWLQCREAVGGRGTRQSEVDST